MPNKYSMVMQMAWHHIAQYSRAEKHETALRALQPMARHCVAWDNTPWHSGMAQRCITRNRIAQHCMARHAWHSTACRCMVHNCTARHSITKQMTAQQGRAQDCIVR